MGDLWQRNFQLALYSVVIGLVGLPATGQLPQILDSGFFQGYTVMTWISMSIQGLGGLLIAVVIKYTDNIMKNIATSMAIIVSVIAPNFIFAAPITPLFFAGMAMVNLSVFWYSR